MVGVGGRETTRRLKRTAHALSFAGCLACREQLSVPVRRRHRLQERAVLWLCGWFVNRGSGGRADTPAGAEGMDTNDLLEVRRESSAGPCVEFVSELFASHLIVALLILVAAARAIQTPHAIVAIRIPKVFESVPKARDDFGFAKSDDVEIRRSLATLCSVSLNLVECGLHVVCSECTTITVLARAAVTLAFFSGTPFGLALTVGPASLTIGVGVAAGGSGHEFGRAPSVTGEGGAELLDCAELAYDAVSTESVAQRRDLARIES